mgnify:CR=1 FL=1
MHILVVEDEVALCDTIVRSLKRLAYSVDYCYDGQKALDMLSVESFDLVVLDLNLPNVDGMTVLKTLRQTDIDTKVLILSARCEVADKVLGLDEGANDYLTKPFHMDELFARIKLQLSDGKIKNELATYGDLSLDTHKLILENTNTKETINIIGKEYNILLILLNSHESIISKEQLFSKVWGYDSDSEINTLEAYMSFIRKKLKNINSKVKIKVIRNIGYKLEYQNEKIKI